VGGSVARGDFNVWSDVDVVVVAEDLPARAPERSSILAEDAPAGVQPVGFTPGEFRDAVRRSNPLAVDAAHGMILRGEELFAELTAAG
jgi:predicted nucleotidyltransferase